MAKLPTWSSRNLKINWAKVDFMGLAPDNAVEYRRESGATVRVIGARGDARSIIIGNRVVDDRY